MKKEDYVENPRNFVFGYLCINDPTSKQKEKKGNYKYQWEVWNEEIELGVFWHIVALEVKRGG